MDDRPDPARRRFLFGSQGADLAPPEAVAAVIGEACFALRGVACMSCRDACAPGAIRFTLARGGARPSLDADACTGCGECIPVCPAGAIALQERAETAHG